MSLAIDILVILIILGNVAVGARWGLISRGFAMAGLYGGVAMASFAGNSIEDFFHGTGHPDDLYATAITFLCVAAAVVLGMEVLAFLYRDRFKKVITLAFDRTAGAVAGGFVGFLESAVIILVMVAVGTGSTSGTQHLPADRTRSSNAVDESFFSTHIAGADPFIRKVFKPVLPDNLSDHLGNQT